MGYAINWSAKAKKQIRKIETRMQETILKAVDELESFPNTRNLTALTNHQYSHRLRVGDFRVLLDIDTAVRIIEIQQIKKRNEETY